MNAFRLCILGVLGGAVAAFGQNREILYDFTDIPQSLLVNPGARAGYQWYAGVPLLSGIGFQTGSSGISAGDIFGADGVDINEKIREKAVYGMNPRDEFFGHVQIELFSGGFRGRYRPRDFYSFGVYAETDGIGYWFGDLAILAWDGNVGQLGKRFDLSHLKTRGEMVSVFHFGVNRQMSSKLILGARGKLYSGIFNFRTTRNRGYFQTVEGEDNLLANILDADMQLRTSGLEGIREALSGDTENQTRALAEHLLSRGLFGGDLGLGVDLGFTYHLSERMLVTGSLLDLGFMVHYSDLRNFSLQGAAVSEGVQIIQPGALDDPDREFWEDLVDDIESLIPFEEDNSAYVSFRPTRLYGSFRYNFGKQMEPRGNCDCDPRISQRYLAQRYQQGTGLQLFMINRPRGPRAALTAFYQRRFGEAMALKVTYTVDRFTATNVGLGMNLQLGPLQGYFMIDNLLAYRNLAEARYASLQFGVNILSWGRN